MKNVIYLSALLASLFINSAAANTVIIADRFEPNLLGDGGILDMAFDLDNLQRIDDGLDQVWTVSGDVTATVVFSQPGFSQNFGIHDAINGFSPLLDVPYKKSPHSADFDYAIGSEIAFGLTRGVMPAKGNKPVLSSVAGDNVVCKAGACDFGSDLMVSWLITDGMYAGDYIFAWEDLRPRGNSDYRDLVVRVSGVTAVPVPAAVWLFASGLVGLSLVARRRTNHQSKR